MRVRVCVCVCFVFDFLFIYIYIYKSPRFPPWCPSMHRYSQPSAESLNSAFCVNSPWQTTRPGKDVLLDREAKLTYESGSLLDHVFRLSGTPVELLKRTTCMQKLTGAQA